MGSAAFKSATCHLGSPGVALRALRPTRRPSVGCSLHPAAAGRANVRPNLHLDASCPSLPISGGRRLDSAVPSVRGSALVPQPRRRRVRLLIGIYYQACARTRRRRKGKRAGAGAALLWIVRKRSHGTGPATGYIVSSVCRRRRSCWRRTRCALTTGLGLCSELLRLRQRAVPPAMRPAM